MWPACAEGLWNGVLLPSVRPELRPPDRHGDDGEAPPPRTGLLVFGRSSSVDWSDVSTTALPKATHGFMFVHLGESKTQSPRAIFLSCKLNICLLFPQATRGQSGRQVLIPAGRGGWMERPAWHRQAGTIDRGGGLGR
jgi:hypothetical protein